MLHILLMYLKIKHTVHIAACVLQLVNVFIFGELNLYKLLELLFFKTTRGMCACGINIIKYTAHHIQCINKIIKKNLYKLFK